jgi:hypothetical protein
MARARNWRRKTSLGSDDSLSIEEVTRQCENSRAQSLRRRTPKKSSLRLYYESILIIFCLPMFLILFVGLLIDII